MRCILAIPLVLLAGCSMAPHYEPPQVPLPGNYHDQADWTRATPADQLPRGSWWSIFDDGALSALEEQCDAQNPSLAAAVARYDAAHAYLDEARSGLLPTLSLGVHVTRNRQSNHRPLRSANQPDVYDDRLAGGGLSYELDLWGRVRNAVSAQRALAQAQSALVESVRLSLETRLAAEYFQLRELDERAALLQDSIDIYTHSLDVARARHDQGVASGLDVAQAQTQLEDARSSLIDVRSTRALLEHAIAVLVGAPASTFALEKRTGLLKLPDVPAGVPSTLLQRRPDVAAAERTMAAANSAIGVARAAWFPSLSLSALGGFQDTAMSPLLASPNTYWTLGPQALLTLFDGGRRRALNDVAQAKYREAASDYRGQVLQAMADVEDDLTRLHDLAAESQSQDAAVDAARRARDLSWALYQLGAASYTDVAIAQNAALRIELSASAVRASRLIASVHLIQAIGGNWEGLQDP